MTPLDIAYFKLAAKAFAAETSASSIVQLYGKNDGKAVGTYVEQAFNNYLKQMHSYTPGNAASGIDFPEINVDLKVTDVRQPQSSCPFRDASQKVYGLGYHLLVFVYDKHDDHNTRSARLEFRHTVFISRERTGDYQTTRGLLDLLEREANKDDIVAFLEDRNLPLDEIGRDALATRIIDQPPELGCLTISNALQWRLQYGRAIVFAGAGATSGVEELLHR